MFLRGDIVKLKIKVPGLKAQKYRIIDVNDYYPDGDYYIIYHLGRLTDGTPTYKWVDDDSIEYVMTMDEFLFGKEQ